MNTNLSIQDGGVKERRWDLNHLLLKWDIVDYAENQESTDKWNSLEVLNIPGQ